jgi:hypothetical protein
MTPLLKFSTEPADLYTFWSVKLDGKGLNLVILMAANTSFSEN